MSVCLIFGVRSTKSSGRSSEVSEGSEDEESLDREALAFRFLSTVCSSVDDLKEIGSSQQRAYAWITEEDGLQLKIPKSLTDDNASTFVSRYVLAVLYFALDGSKWSEKFNFLTQVDACAWASVYGSTYGILCNAQFEPYSIDMTLNSLKGFIP
eukprot:CAMPEP_0197835348 /NCGR_PEP_ID=MMETSP1437-20131217/25448_1 /TAXON_ID=49252 ORGANISM="Eucampia antarctica, Strain CCMP1452" /NCGR_SAMPLE_ID=MMETSP1437 /ASSEMBLY_ACC=CAM_ASM_001096 /LENGTH=153 /DNA_ID=CAMNT_0043440699 /DNA_START=225 /DNA_END=682 /DNA_ORIENTATION=+